MKKQAEGTRLMSRTHELPISEADARVFVTVANAGSFTAAAALHAMTPSAVSKAIGRLESDLGVQLLTRTTRALHLTEEGMAFHERCARAFELLAEAVEEAGAGAHAVSGTVRVGLPPLFGTFVVAPMLPALLARHPKLRIEIVSTMLLSDIFDLGLDVAIAVGALPDSSLVARPLGYGQFVTVAAPACFGGRSRPSRPEELLAHQCLAYTRPDGREESWNFKTPEGPLQIETRADVRSDDMHHLAAMTVTGLGIAHLPMFVVNEHIASGRLDRLLQDFEPAPKLASLVYPASRSMPRRVRAFIDFLLSGKQQLAGVMRPSPLIE
ncbi:LysR family transcriptional regulator [Variovorax sp. NFACC27]|uniref:LysR family transcriptional regulator n=1 Tax=unclassified Variovorax TaxID=663243 RepID=UPI000899411D|nr:regulatory helix-turn-helix protein, lysR family [Variovorax sp. NFACC28]SEG86697.1 regulatory helix-turn-helix protein, lysR family [Variovorax sp. NFACC29]SFD31672.1 regulatory helix-turn-helix protein, lysR family [Variovorax sp. NFACC26]SFG31782.1 regulatory helix-turn-helix protein, lysR family [Variovorax sp. NFACC27]